MRTGLRLCLSFLLLLPLLAAGVVVTQDATPTPTPTPTPTLTPTPKPPLPLPKTPKVSLESNVNDNDVEVGNFKIENDGTSQFSDAESVDLLAINAATRGEVELSVSPSSAGTFKVSAETLEYDASKNHVISFSMVMVAALDDPDYVTGPYLVFCYPVTATCQDPATIVRALPPPTGGTVTLVTEEAQAAAQSSGGGTFTLDIPLQGTVFQNADGFQWIANNNSNNSSASGQQSGNTSQAQAQAVDAEGAAFAITGNVTIQFGANLVGYGGGSQEVVRIQVQTVAPSGSNQYANSHTVNYYYCNDPNVDCASLYHSGNGGNGDNGDQVGGGETCLNTDNAAPIKVCANSDYTSYTLYGVTSESTTVSLASVKSTSSLCTENAASNTNLASGTNSAANKSYKVSYDGSGDNCDMTLSTFYADKGMDVDKKYVITIDEHHTVSYVHW